MKSYAKRRKELDQYTKNDLIWFIVQLEANNTRLLAEKDEIRAKYYGNRRDHYKYRRRAHIYKIELGRCQRKLHRIYAEHIRIQDSLKAMVLFINRNMRIVTKNNLEELWHISEEINRLRDI